MKNIKLKQLSSEIHCKLSEIISRLNNSISSYVTIIEVELNGDNSNAKIYVSFLKGDDKKSLEQLNNASTYIRRELSNSLNTKKTPALEFILDDKLEKINEVEYLIDKVNK